MLVETKKIYQYVKHFSKTINTLMYQKKSNCKNHLIFKVNLLAQTTSICLNDVSDKKNICNTVFITYYKIAQA